MLCQPRVCVWDVNGFPLLARVRVPPFADLSGLAPKQLLAERDVFPDERSGV